ncbi:MAG: hypothetical protein NT069_03215 [Planctomycetota bacterium]|nr:hypothetical protein [Planctomycetota bacterium]
MVTKIGNYYVMRLATPVPDYNVAFPAVVASEWPSGFATLDLQLGNETLPFSQPITLTSGIVIDLKWSSDSAKTLAIPKSTNDPVPAIDIMFSPRGGVTGAISATGPIHFLINDLTDAITPDAADAYDNSTGRHIPDGKPDDPRMPLSPIDKRNRGEKMVLTVFPQTGNVQAFPIDATDDYDNITGAKGADGLADDLFHFARIGSVGN